MSICLLLILLIYHAHFIVNLVEYDSLISKVDFAFLQGQLHKNTYTQLVPCVNNFQMTKNEMNEAEFHVCCKINIACPIKLDT